MVDWDGQEEDIKALHELVQGACSDMWPQVGKPRIVLAHAFGKAVARTLFERIYCTARLRYF